jgi:hypothetical protein
MKILITTDFFDFVSAYLWAWIQQTAVSSRISMCPVLEYLITDALFV